MMTIYSLAWIAVPGFICATIVAVIRSGHKVKLAALERDRLALEIRKEEVHLARLTEEGRLLDQDLSRRLP